MKVLFVMLHPGFIRYYDGALRLLAAGGHEIHLAFEMTRDKLREDLTARRLAGHSPPITCGTTPERAESVRAFLARGDRTAARSGETFHGAGAQSDPGAARDAGWESLATTVRLMGDYLRFFEPAFAGASALRARAGRRLPDLHARVVRAIAHGGRPARALLAAALRLVERLIPVSGAVDAFVRHHDPDVLLVTPLVELGSQQVDYVKSARRLGVPSVLCVASWDNLTSKGLIRVLPDHAIVWNEAQRAEAATLHGMAPDRVLVTGAQPFDDWFDAAPSRSRESFCAMVGLDPGRPYVLYVGSSIFIAPEEVPFAERWLSHLRRSADADLAAVGVLIRPHPANARQWHAFDRAAFSHAAIWPPIGTDPNAPDFRRDFFDSVYYSAGVVGINTSALIEAGIVGRPVFTIRAPEFAHAQAGTLHFQHLVGAGRTLVREAQTLSEHEAQLAAALRGGADLSPERRVVSEFVRPRGIDVAAAPAWVDAVESVARGGRHQPRPDRRWVRAARPLAAIAARAARALAEDRPLWVYVARPFVSVSVWVAAQSVRLWVDGGEAIVVAARREYRAGRRIWHASAKRVSKHARRARRSVSRTVLHAGATAWRVVRRAR